MPGTAYCADVHAPHGRRGAVRHRKRHTDDPRAIIFARKTHETIASYEAIFGTNTVTLGPLDIKAAIAAVETQLKDDKQTSQAMKSAVALLLILVKFLLARPGMNSSNSSRPPARDPLRVRKSRAVSDKPVGGQVGRVGITLKPVEDPDHIEVISIDRRTLPRGHYHDAGVECRQIIEPQIERVVTEYRAHILENENGHRFVAQFPAGVTRPAQDGTSVKANAVDMSMFQLIPYARVKTHFTELFETPISTGTLSNFNREAYERRVDFEVLSIKHLSRASVVHADETGITIEGKRHRPHNASSSDWTLLYPHIKRGQEAMRAMAVLPDVRGTWVHDHWADFCSCKICMSAIHGGQAVLPLRRHTCGMQCPSFARIDVFFRGRGSTLG